MQPKPLDLKQFIAKLEGLAERDFPVEEAHRFLKETSIRERDLEPYLLFSGHHYTRNLIVKSAGFELMAICWQPGQQAPVHGHEGEKCWSRVERGKLRFTTYQEIDRSSPLALRLLSSIDAGPGHLDGPADIHAVQNLFQEPAVSLHLYSKPYDACDIYDLEKGTKQRRTLSYHSISGKLCD